MGRTVSDVARVLQVISDPDPAQISSTMQTPVPSYISALNPSFIRGKRIGVLRGFYAELSEIKEQERIVLPHYLAAFEEALTHLRKEGAELVDDVEIETAREISKQRAKEFGVFRAEFKVSFSIFVW